VLQAKFTFPAYDFSMSSQYSFCGITLWDLLRYTLSKFCAQKWKQLINLIVHFLIN
jgi:hypothetical protein